MTNYKPLALVLCLVTSSSAIAAEFVLVKQDVLKANWSLLHSADAVACMKQSI